MRAVGHALVLVLGLAGHVYIAPACTGGEDNGLGLERATVGQLHFHQAAGMRSGNQLLGALQVHDVHIIGTGVGFQCSGELGAVGFQHGDVVLDRQRVVDLTAKALGRHAGANALASCVHGGCRAGRAAADDQHVEGVLGRQLGCVTRGCTSVQLGHDFLDGHATGAEHAAVHEHHGHGHDFALGHFLLEGTAFDHRGLDLGVENGHQRQRLNHVGAVVAAQAHIDLEVEVAVQCLDLVDDRLLDFGRMAAGLQQGEDERGEFMPRRDAGKVDARRFAGQADGEGGAAGGVAVFAQADLGGEAGDIDQQVAHFAGLGAVVERGDEFDRALEFFEIGRQLGLDVGVKHGFSPFAEFHCNGPQVGALQ
ncbi:hypothetical protein SDC9_117418 [bioreactor metagenome]|uniref:Uncharacterized protein n=1 Tax=bioreactor metagenome TaxID=1076179 RepID=A0A645C538_9ZZZZ